MFDFKDHIVIVAISFLATLGCYTALAAIGSDGQEALRILLSAFVGGITGVAIQKKT